MHTHFNKNLTKLKKYINKVHSLTASAPNQDNKCTVPQATESMPTKLDTETMAQKHLCVSTLIWLCITSCESFLPLTNRTWLQNRYGYEKESRRNSEMTDRTNGLTASPHEDCQCIVHITASLSMRQHHRTKMSFAYSTEEIGK